MMLLVDIGNSRCKLASVEAMELQAPHSYDYVNVTLESRAAWIAECIVKHAHPQTAIRIVSVLGEEFWQQLCHHLHDAGIEDIRNFRNGDLSSVQIGYKNAHELGADRLAALLAVQESQLGNAIIIDAGTAITIDALRADGCHLGGLIIPGRTAMLTALNKNAAQLPQVRLGATVDLANNTQDGIYSGCMLLLQHGICGVIEQLKENLPQASLWLTGGDGYWLQEQLPMSATLDEMLVLRGVWRAFR